MALYKSENGGGRIQLFTKTWTFNNTSMEAWQENNSQSISQYKDIEVDIVRINPADSSQAAFKSFKYNIEVAKNNIASTRKINFKFTDERSMGDTYDFTLDGEFTIKNNNMDHVYISYFVKDSSHPINATISAYGIY